MHRERVILSVTLQSNVEAPGVAVGRTSWLSWLDRIVFLPLEALEMSGEKGLALIGRWTAKV